MDLKSECELSFYKDLYKVEDKDYTIVINELTGVIFCKKKRSLYNLSVFQYIKDHPTPNIPKIERLWEENNYLYVIEEYIQGQTLEEYLAHNYPTEEFSLYVIIELCKALEHLHKAKPPIVHRDIKPSNIMITNDNNIKLIDYDAAKTHDSRKSQDTVLIGTAGSAAPEQYGFGQSDSRTDIYGLGILMKILFNKNEKYTPIITKATEIAPKDRYNNISDFKYALEMTAKRTNSYTLPIPGFRTGNPRNILFAILGYAMILFFSFIIGSNYNSTNLQRCLTTIVSLVIMLLSVFLYTEYFSFIHKLPLIRSSDFIPRFIGMILYSIMLLLIWISLIILIITIL